MQGKESQNAINILSRIKQAYNMKTDTELALFLGVSQNTISTWKKRDSIDYKLIISKCDKINLDWILTGDGGMIKENISISGNRNIANTGSIKGDIVSGSKNIIDNDDKTQKKMKRMQLEINRLKDIIAEKDDQLLKAKDNIIQLLLKINK